MVGKGKERLTNFTGLYTQKILETVESDDGERDFSPYQLLGGGREIPKDHLGGEKKKELPTGSYHHGRK